MEKKLLLKLFISVFSLLSLQSIQSLQELPEEVEFPQEIREQLSRVARFKARSPQLQNQQFEREVVDIVIQTAIQKFEAEGRKFDKQADSWVRSLNNSRQWGMSTDYEEKQINFYRDLSREYSQAANDLKTKPLENIQLGSFSNSSFRTILDQKIDEFTKNYYLKPEEAEKFKQNPKLQRLTKIATEYKDTMSSRPLFSPNEQPKLTPAQPTQALGWWDSVKQSISNFFSFKTPSYEKSPSLWEKFQQQKKLYTLKNPYIAPTRQKTFQRAQKASDKPYEIAPGPTFKPTGEIKTTGTERELKQLGRRGLGYQ